jgi:hypothetical protein
MNVRSKKVYKATQYNKRGDHPNEYIWSESTPIIGEKEGAENRWPNTGRLGTLDECEPTALRYVVHVTMADARKANRKSFPLNLSDWILERDGKVVGVMPDALFKRDFEVVEDASTSELKE